MQPLRRVRPGRLSPRRMVPAEIPRPDYVPDGRPGRGIPGDPATRLERMRRACRGAAQVLREVGAAVRPGVTTDALDALTHAAYIARGGAVSGTPPAVITSATLSALYGTPVEVLRTADGRLVVVGHPEAPARHTDRHAGGPALPW